MNEGPPKPRSRLSRIEDGEQIVVSFGVESIAKENHTGINEDSILTDLTHRAFGVFDGFGGHEDGHLASELARDYISAEVPSMQDGTSLQEAERKLRDSFMGADITVQRAANKNRTNMKTTGVLLKIHTDENGVNYSVIVNVGDSRVYRFSADGSLHQLTEDDDALRTSDLKYKDIDRLRERFANVRNISDLNDLSNKEYKFFERRREVSKSLGSGINPLATHFVVNKGDRFIVSSDGIHDNLTTSEIREIMASTQDEKVAARKLVEKSLERSRQPRAVESRAKPDDMSAIVVAIR